MDETEEEREREAAGFCVVGECVGAAVGVVGLLEQLNQSELAQTAEEPKRFEQHRLNDTQKRQRQCFNCCGVGHVEVDCLHRCKTCFQPLNDCACRSTTTCRFWLQNSCNRGARCLFRHGTLPPPYQDWVGRGSCCYGDNCNVSHFRYVPGEEDKKGNDKKDHPDKFHSRYCGLLRSQRHNSLQLRNLEPRKDANAQVVIVNTAKAQFLVQLRSMSMPFMPGHLGAVGGQRDADDIDSRHTAQREVFEECGMEDVWTRPHDLLLFAQGMKCDWFVLPLPEAGGTFRKAKDRHECGDISRVMHLLPPGSTPSPAFGHAWVPIDQVELLDQLALPVMSGLVRRVRLAWKFMTRHMDEKPKASGTFESCDGAG